MADPTLRDDCACGHDRTCHFDGTHNCLAVRCDCRRFGTAARPKARVLPPANYPRPLDTRKNKPHHNTTCPCDACRDWERQRRWGEIDDGWPA